MTSGASATAAKQSQDGKRQAGERLADECSHAEHNERAGMTFEAYSIVKLLLQAF
jgi:hypothetical protein